MWSRKALRGPLLATTLTLCFACAQVFIGEGDGKYWGKIGTPFSWYVWNCTLPMRASALPLFANALVFALPTWGLGRLLFGTAFWRRESLYAVVAASLARVYRVSKENVSNFLKTLRVTEKRVYDLRRQEPLEIESFEELFLKGTEGGKVGDRTSSALRSRIKQDHFFNL